MRKAAFLLLLPEQVVKNLKYHCVSIEVQFRNKNCFAWAAVAWQHLEKAVGGGENTKYSIVWEEPFIFYSFFFNQSAMQLAFTI